MELSNLNIKNGLCISLGANIDSKFGKPIETLTKCRPEIEETIKNWICDFESKETTSSPNIQFYWSSIYVTSPHGISEPQPNYLNSLLLIKSLSLLNPSSEKAKYLLKTFKSIEKEYGRNIIQNNKKWLSRCLDIDILWWENFNIQDSFITLPHPRFMNRNFIITPLAEILNKFQKVDKLIEKSWKI